MSDGVELVRAFERAVALHGQGKLREAFLRYEAILQAQPRHAGALHLSGVVLHQSGRLAAAAERIRASLGIDPANAQAWSNLALVLEGANRPEAAVNALKEAARHAPNDPSIAANLAASLLGVGRASDAEGAAREAVALDASHAGAWFNLALALHAQGRALEALDAASRANALAPGEPAYAGLKAQLEDGAGAPAKARATLESALARQPIAAALRFELAGLLERAGDLAGALAAYEQVLRHDPSHGPALSDLVFLKRKVADWNGLAALEQRMRQGAMRNQPLLSPFVLLSQASTRAEQRRCAESWARALAGPPQPARRRRLSPDRLRVGYLSADFHEHATAFLAAGLFEQHDRTRFAVTAYSTGPDDGSAMRRRLERAFDRFVDARALSPDELAGAIRADGIDILVDLKGHTAGAPPRVLALRPAPIQVHYLGYPGTIGGGLVDYLIGDPIVTPPEHAADYAEALVRLPATYQINDRERPIVDPPARAALGLPADGAVLVNFGAAYKINAEVMDAWTAILREVPDAVLWLLARDATEPAVANLRREAEARGVDPARLVFALARPNAEYLGLYRHADLFLDTWPYNAHTTASDALWGGCPVVTRIGDTFAGRVAASLLTAVGLPALIAEDSAQYVAKAIAIARDRHERRRLRAYLEGPGQDSPLFDTTATTRALESAYLAMAEQYRAIATRTPIDLAA